MIKKVTKLTPPIDENKIIALETFLDTVSKQALRGSSGIYTADGNSGFSVSIGYAPSIIIISKFIDIGKSAFPSSGNWVFSAFVNEGVSYIPGTGFVKDAVLSFSNTGVTLGINANVNSIGDKFFYYAIG